MAAIENLFLQVGLGSPECTSCLEQVIGHGPQWPRPRIALGAVSRPLFTAANCDQVFLESFSQIFLRSRIQTTTKIRKVLAVRRSFVTQDDGESFLLV